jgi:hypothetical protein
MTDCPICGAEFGTRYYMNSTDRERRHHCSAIATCTGCRRPFSYDQTAITTFFDADGRLTEHQEFEVLM